MTSRHSSTPSEGEIVESGSEKANPSQPSVNDNLVDRRSRRRASGSRSPSSVHSSQRGDRRTHSRSRSPFRASRGSKRSHEDDHYGRHDRHDPRNSKAQSEDGRSEKRAGERGSYRDYDRDASSHHRLRYDDGYTSRPRDKRQRTISRSPPRFNDRKGYNDHRKPHRDDRYDPSSSRLNSDRRDGKARYHSEQSVSDDRAKHGPSTALAKSDAKGRNNQTSRGENATQEINGRSIAARGDVVSRNAPRHEAEAEPLDEAALIEQRRKRREAIKAKHRGQATPLLVQALNISNATSTTTSTPATPSETTQLDGTSTSTPPDSPREVSSPNSPSAFAVSKDVDLANSNVEKHVTEQDDGPSAVDYDPTMDMEEDRARHLPVYHEEVSAKAYDETTDNNQGVLIPKESIEQEPAQGTKDEFDMFADDDDMFAEASPIAKRGDATKAVPVAKAKALDMSMLDDWDDAEGYYKIILGELLDGRYHVQFNLGRGMFSAVVRAMDEVTKKLVAIKIIRANDTMRKAAVKELDILATLKDADPEDKKHMIRLERHFEHKGHLCMVFEHLSINLREVLKKFGRDVGINLKAVRAYAQQMFLGLTLLRKSNILHADLKPDNILVNEARNMLKICDLGSASDASENEITPYLVSRFYRAPEIILGIPYDFAIDMWSVGCTLFELYTGKILFTGRSNNQMLRSIMECRGKFSHKVLRKAEFAHMHFDDLLNFHSVERDKLTGKDSIRPMNFNKPTRDLRSRLLTNSKGMADVDTKEINHFIDLLEKCLTLNPEKRCTPAEALKHPFVTRLKS